MESQPLPALRPLRLGELLDQAIRLYRRNFVTFVGIVALVYVPLMVLQTASTALMTSSATRLSTYGDPRQIFTNSGYWIGMLGTLVIAFLQFIFVQGIATGALTRAVADNYLGKKTSIVDAYRGIGRSWPTLLGALILVGILLIILLVWWIIVPCVGWFTGLGMLAFLSAAISPMVAPIVVLEQSGPWSTSGDGIFDRVGKYAMRITDAVRRAWSLVRRRFWPVLGTIFVLYLFNLLIVNGPTTIVSIILQSATSSMGNDSMRFVITAVIQALVSVVFILIYYPLQMTAFTLIYFDLRVRTEGFDLTLLTSGDAEQALTTPVQQAKESLITGADLGNFAILTLGAFGLYIFLFSFIFGGLFFFGTLFNRFFMRRFLAIWLIVFLSLSNLAAVGVPPIPFDGYWELVRNTRQALVRLEALPANEIRKGLDDLASKWEKVTAVEFPDQTVIAVDPSYLVAILKQDSPDLKQLVSLMDALLKAHDEFPQKMFSVQDVTPLKEILARPEFQWSQAQAPQNPQWLQNILDAITKLMDRLAYGIQNGVYYGRIPLIVAAVIVFIISIFFIARNVSRNLVREVELAAENADDDALLTSKGAMQRAQTLSSQGDYRTAVRYLYLSSLLVLDEHGVLRYDRSRTNREYLRSVSKNPELVKPLSDVIDVFDRVWYGFDSVDEETYQSYVKHVDELREKKE